MTSELCPECKATCYNVNADEDDNAVDYLCEICGCEFTSQYKHDVVVTKHGDNKGGK